MVMTMKVAPTHNPAATMERIWGNTTGNRRPRAITIWLTLHIIRLEKRRCNAAEARVDRKAAVPNTGHPQPKIHGEGTISRTIAGRYLSIRCSERLAEAGIDPSVASVGDSCGNALAETVNGLYKFEVIHGLGPRSSFEVVEYAILEGVDWFNNHRPARPHRQHPARRGQGKSLCSQQNFHMTA